MFRGSGVSEAGKRNQAGGGKRERKPGAAARNRRVSASLCHTKGRDRDRGLSSFACRVCKKKKN